MTEKKKLILVIIFLGLFFLNFNVMLKLKKQA